MSSEALSLSYSTSATHVAGRMGGMVPIAGPLIDPMLPPRGGWGVVITVAGHQQNVTGEAAKTVFQKARELLHLNGSSVSDTDLWFNLNIQWYQPTKLNKGHRQPTTLEALMAVARGNDAPVMAHVSRANVPPKVWGAKGWGALQMFLAQDTYEYRRFLTLANEVANWVNPDMNPSIGCSECYRHYVQALSEIRGREVHSQHEAREWLVKTMNAVNQTNGKKELTFAEAATINFWT